MWRKYEGDFDWTTKSVLDICDNVIRYAKYPKFYYVREGNTEKENGMFGGECVNKQTSGGKHPLGAYTHYDNNPAYMAKVQHLVSAEAVLSSASRTRSRWKSTSKRSGNRSPSRDTIARST